MEKQKIDGKILLVKISGTLSEGKQSDINFDAIQKLAQKEMHIPKSMLGAHPEMKKFVREEDDFRDI